MPLGGEDVVVGRGGVLAVAAADQQPEPAGLFGRADDGVAGLLGEPGAVGVGGDAERVDPAGGELPDYQDVWAW
jgi:hypothetical protein